MNRKLIFLGSLALGVVLQSRAQNLLFTDVSSGSSSNFATLDAIAYGGGSNFVVAGTSSNVLLGTFSGSGSILGNEFTWTTPLISSQASNVYAQTFGGNANIGFVAGGQFARTFASSNGMNWSLLSNAFQSPFQVTGLAYSSGGGTFAAVGGGPVASWAGSSLSTWSNAQITAPPPVFLESYRGVTALGAGSFVLCGVRGTIRISTDAGLTWVQAGTNVFDSTEPDYLGIVTAGNTIVCVGTNNSNGQGAIIVSADGGSTWAKASSGVTNALYAVAYTGSEFLAVGSHGIILASTNGTAWQTIGVNITSKSLFGAAFATNGPLQGVALLVGTGGAVLLGGEKPPVPIDPVSQTNCAFPNLNQPLSVSLDTNLFSPASGLTVDWFDAAGNQVFTNSLSFTPTNTVAGIYTNYAQARDKRTGLVSATRVPVTLTVNPLPTAIFTNITVVDFCSGTNTDINVQLTGNGPWTVTWSDGLVTNVSTTNYTRTVNPTTTPLVSYTTNFFITALSDTNCNAMLGSTNIIGTATFTVNPRPTAAFTNINVADFCSGTNTDINVQLTGTAPWTVTWADGLITNVSTPNYTRTVNPTTTPLVSYNTNYFITTLSDANCSANLASNDISGTATFTVNPRPTAIFTNINVADFCSGSNTTINVHLTGTAPWTVTWSDGLITNVSTASYQRSVNPTTTQLVSYATNFFITALSDANCNAVLASNDIAGTAAFIVNPRPTATFTNITVADFCSGSNTAINVQLTGTAPWAVMWSDGLVTNLSTTNYTRIVHPTTTALVSYTTNYFIAALSDANCHAVVASNDLAGTATFIVNPRPTAVFTNITVADFCNGSNTTINVRLTGTAPWTVTWSDGSLPEVTGISNYSRTVNPTTTSFVPYTTNYSIIALSDANCNANLASNDLAGTATFIVKPRPTASLQPLGVAETCSGTTNSLIVSLTGTAPWTVTWSDGFVASVSTNNYTRNVHPTTTPTVSYATNYFIMALSDANCMAQATDISGTNAFTVNPSPTLTSFTGNNIICNGSTTPLVTTIGGSLGPWLVTYMVMTTTNGGSSVTNFTQTNSTSPFTNFLTLSYAETNAITNNYIITSVIDTLTLCPASGLPSAPVQVIVHSSAPPPGNPVNAVTCPGFTPYPPLSVTVPAGVVVNWYDSLGNPVATNTTKYFPVGPAMPTNTPATNYTFYAETVASLGVGGCTNTNRVPLILTVKDCSTPLSIQLVSTNVVLTWPGDRDLQITNALPLGTNTNGWVTVATGVFGTTNSWTNGIGGFGGFFRLFPYP